MCVCVCVKHANAGVGAHELRLGASCTVGASFTVAMTTMFNALLCVKNADAGAGAHELWYGFLVHCGHETCGAGPHTGGCGGGA